MQSRKITIWKRTLLALCASALCVLCIRFLPTRQAAASAPAAARQVRVGVAVPALGSGIPVASLRSDGGFSVGVSSADGRGFEARSSLSASSILVKPTGNGQVALLDATGGQTLYTHTGERPLALKSARGQSVTLVKNEKDYPYPGFLELSADGGELRIVNVIDRETYVKCVMCTEIGTNASREVRRAFSVLIRTVPMTPKHTSNGCDVCASTCCQVYRGNQQRDAENDAIVDSTAGEYITYEGIPIQCLYHGGNGGASCSSVAAWGGGEVPYLKSVSLPETEGNASNVWQYVFTPEELFDFLSTRAAFKGIAGGVESVEIAETDPYGSSYVTLLSVTDGQNNLFQLATSEEVRRALKFASANFTVSYTVEATLIGGDGVAREQTVEGYLDADGVYRTFDSFAEFPVAGSSATVGADHIVFDGVGSGHGVGFSAVGAEQLVEEGYSYKYLISFYFEGTEIRKLP